ncbi:MAG: hypothetical protein FJX42_06400 [Alphaproteobacteria bacterium]|nr:hypothetical protein [Alphaproteobacteria bacterium]
MSNTVSDGAEVVFLGGAGGVIAILVSWPNESIENYLFYINKEGFGEVVWGTFRYDGMNNKGSVFQAECRAPGK